MDTSHIPQAAESTANTTPKQRLPRTICFGRGSTKVFQRNFQKKSKKKVKNKSDNEKHTSQEVTMNEVS